MNTNDELPFEKRSGMKTKKWKLSTTRIEKSDAYQRAFGFNCIHCKNPVQSDRSQSGVINRNHCPYCLWSRHVDLWQAGDRLCACKMPMQPIGLTFKKLRNKYGSSLGELMIIHQCNDCHAISINRIATDDDSHKILEIMEGSLILQKEQVNRLQNSGIEPVPHPYFELVREQLLGKTIKVQAAQNLSF